MRRSEKSHMQWSSSAQAQRDIRVKAVTAASDRAALRVGAPSGFVAACRTTPQKSEPRLTLEDGAAGGCRIGRAGAGGLMLSSSAAAPARLPRARTTIRPWASPWPSASSSAFLFYIIPALIAWDRQHPDVRWIWALTLLLGWTGIGWLLALIWALRTTGRQARTSPCQADRSFVTPLPGAWC